MCKPKNRRLVDVRQVERLPSCRLVQGILVPVPAELILQKLISMANRPNTPKGMIDGADLRRLLLTFPELKADEGPVADALRAAQVPGTLFDAWRGIVAHEIEREDEDAGY